MPRVTTESARRRPLMLIAVAALATGSLLVPAAPAQAAATTFTVNDAADTDDGACDAADCTLREAIAAANGNGNGADVDRIAFDIPDPGSGRSVRRARCRRSPRRSRSTATASGAPGRTPPRPAPTRCSRSSSTAAWPAASTPS